MWFFFLTSENVTLELICIDHSLHWTEDALIELNKIMKNKDLDSVTSKLIKTILFVSRGKASGNATRQYKHVFIRYRKHQSQDTFPNTHSLSYNKRKIIKLYDVLVTVNFKMCLMTLETVKRTNAKMYINIMKYF